MPRLKLLLIEDSDIDAELIYEELRIGGYEPDAIRVESEEEILSVIGENAFDIIISDYNLPSFSGKDALLLMLEHGYTIPFIIVSGAIGEETAVDLMKSGAQDYLMKSNLSRLAPAVRNAIRASELRRLNEVAEKELEDSREKLRDLAIHLEEVREKERASIARDLHDSVGANLTAIKMDISRLQKQFGGQDESLATKLSAVANMLDYSILEVRKIISDLRPSILDHLGLIAAIDWQLKEFGKRFGLEVVLGPADESIEDLLAADAKVAIFRMFQEALSNVAKHAHASRVTIDIFNMPDHVRISIKDNGCGFEGEAPSDQLGHFGLLGLRERARNLGGCVEIDSARGQGVHLSIHVPVNKNVS